MSAAVEEKVEDVELRALGFAFAQKEIDAVN